MPVKRRRLSYALIGACLAQGAAIGLLAVRLARERELTLRGVSREISRDLDTYLYVLASTTIVFSVFGGLVGHLADKLDELATTDPLTGLLNLRAFRDRFHEELVHALRYGEPLSVLLVDLDGLKAVNDVYGHPAGDQVLRRVAAAIRHGLREADVGARVGGDEFAVLAPNTTDTASVVLGERLRTLVADAQAGGTLPPATVSIGIGSLASFDRDGITELTLTHHADQALYEAKRQGGNRVIATAVPGRTSVPESTATGESRGRLSRTSGAGSRW